MSGATVRYKVDFEKPKRRKAAKVEAMPAPERPPSRAAQSLALAYLVERLIDEGRLESYAEAARMLGVTRARMTQVMDLLNVAPHVQESLLLTTLVVSERKLRKQNGGVQLNKRSDGTCRDWVLTSRRDLVSR